MSEASSAPHAPRALLSSTPTSRKHPRKARLPKHIAQLDQEWARLRFLERQADGRRLSQIEATVAHLVADNRRLSAQVNALQAALAKFAQELDALRAQVLNVNTTPPPLAVSHHGRPASSV